MPKIIAVNKSCKIVNVDVEKLEIKDVLSYSRIDCFKSCEYKYKLKYIDKNYTNDTSLALQIGTILHLGLEFKYLNKYSVDKIIKIVYEGYQESGEHIKGINQLKDDYPFDWEEKDKMGNTYDEKLKHYFNRLNQGIDKDWECIACEKEFAILFNDKVVIKGFIDRIDKNIITGELRVIDYKSSKKLYDKKDLATPMQMYIYALACKEIYGQYPEEFVYDMVLLGDMQNAMTKGWENRGYKSLNNKIDSLIWHSALDNKSMKPKPSPLCYYCSYCNNNPNSEGGSHLCEYYSLWTPTDKTYKKNKEWTEDTTGGWEDAWE